MGEIYSIIGDGFLNNVFNNYEKFCSLREKKLRNKFFYAINTSKYFRRDG